MEQTKHLYQIATTFLHGLGPKLVRQAVAYLGGVEPIFFEKKRLLEKAPGIGALKVKQLNRKEALQRAEQELDFVQKHTIQTLFYLDSNYPNRLKECADAPLLLYAKGNANLNNTHVVGMVGTRNATNYGRMLCEKFIADLSAHYPDAIVVSGLAYGIDICAHKAALKNNLSTVAVFGNGLDMVYPALHVNTAKQMVERGALLTEFPSGSKPDRQNFVVRNRVVAGLCDATVVVESAEQGGSLITANLALSYNRDVYAFPGSVGSEFSAGCNHLIKTNRAGLIESFHDFEFQMGWEAQTKRATQKAFRHELEGNDKKLVEAIYESPSADINLLCKLSGIELGELSTMLFELEMRGVIKKVPGNVFEIA